VPEPDALSVTTALPDLFIDRSLGRLRVPAGLRAVGLRLVTLAEHDGVPADKNIEDTTWLREASDSAGR
jgi:hypothetical protein